MHAFENQLKTLALLGAMTTLILALGSWVAPRQMPIFLLIAIGMNVWAYFYSDRAVLAMHGATELHPSQAPDLHEMVAELAARANIPVPRLFYIAEDQPNAFATGRNPEHGVVAVTDGIVRMLDPRELRGVLAHEIAHIANRDILVSTIAAIGASILTSVAQSAGFAFMRGDDDEDGVPAGAGFLLTLVAPLAATLVQMGISRTREYLADDLGAQISGDPEALASALWKLEQAAHTIPMHAMRPATASLFIVNPGGAFEAIARWFSTHPSTEERVQRLMAMRGD